MLYEEGQDMTRQSDAKTVLFLHNNHNTNSNQGKVKSSGM